MSHATPATAPGRHRSAIDAVLGAWLAVGLVIVLLVPEARTSQGALGWPPLPLLLLPAVALATLALSRLPVWMAAARSRNLVPGTRRRRPSLRPHAQARRTGFGLPPRSARTRVAPQDVSATAFPTGEPPR